MYSVFISNDGPMTLVANFPQVEVALKFGLDLHLASNVKHTVFVNKGTDIIVSLSGDERKNN